LKAWEFGELDGCCPSPGGLGHRNLCDARAHAAAPQPLVGGLYADWSPRSTNLIWLKNGHMITFLSN